MNRKMKKQESISESMKDKVVKLYTTPESPACKHVAVFLRSQRIKFEEVDITNPDRDDFLTKNHMFEIGVPSIQVGKNIYLPHALFDGDVLRTEDVLSYVNVEEIEE